MTSEQSEARAQDLTHHFDRDELLADVILDATSMAASPDVFDRCVEQLALAFDVHSAFISVAAPEQPGWTRLIAHWSGEAGGGLFEYDTTGTPCAILQHEPFFIQSDGVQARFPEDEWLAEIGALAYVALRLDGSDGRQLGHLGLVHNEQLQPTASDLRRLKIIAAGLAGRLERERTEREMDRHVAELSATASELDQRNAELEGSLNAFPDMRFRLAADGKFLAVRAGVEAQLVIPQDQIVGTRIFDHFPEPLAGRILAAIDKTLRTSEVTSVRYSIDHDDGRIHYEARLAPLGADEVIAVVRNVND